MPMMAKVIFAGRDLHPRPAARDQAGPPEPSPGPRPAVCDLETGTL